MTITNPSTWGGARSGSGRKAGGRNAIPAEKISREASRHAQDAVGVLAGLLADPDQPGAQVRAIAASALLTASLTSATP